MQLCAESQYKRRQCHDPLETILPMNQVISDQVPIEQGDIDHFDTIEL